MTRIADHAASTNTEVSHGFPDRVLVDFCCRLIRSRLYAGEPNWTLLDGLNHREIRVTKILGQLLVDRPPHFPIHVETSPPLSASRSGGLFRTSKSHATSESPINPR